MHELAEMGQAAHAAYKGGLAPSQARQLRAWTDARQLLAAETAAAAAAAAAAADLSAGAIADAGGDVGAAQAAEAAEGLFRHLDRNGDGRISLAELRAALHELGVGEEAGRQVGPLCRAALRCAVLCCAVPFGELLICTVCCQVL